MPSLFPSGPQLPDFDSMVVKGSYHPSAPIHCALSNASSFPDTQTLLVTPSRESISSALKNYNDDWIARHSGEGKVLELSSSITVLYPPSPAHFSFLMSMLSIDDNLSSLNVATTLVRPPSLLILHELSAYFYPDFEANPNRHSWTLSSYLTLVARTLASFAALTPPDSSTLPSLILFDSHLDHLKLPILKHPSAASKRPASKLENVAFFVQKYFDVVAVFEEDSDEFFINSSQEEENERFDSPRRNRLQFFRQTQLRPFETWSWAEQTDADGGTIFVWDST